MNERIGEFEFRMALPVIIPEHDLIEHYANVGLTSRKLRSARKARTIRFIPIGRTFGYTEEAIADYWEAEEQKCQDIEKRKTLKFADTGSDESRGARSGTPSTTLKKVDEFAAEALASVISRKPKSSSRRKVP